MHVVQPPFEAVKEFFELTSYIVATVVIPTLTWYLYHVSAAQSRMLALAQEREHKREVGEVLKLIQDILRDLNAGQLPSQYWIDRLRVLAETVLRDDHRDNIVSILGQRHGQLIAHIEGQSKPDAKGSLSACASYVDPFVRDLIAAKVALLRHLQSYRTRS